MTKKKARKASKPSVQQGPSTKRVKIDLRPIRSSMKKGIKQLETAIKDARNRGSSKRSIQQAEKRLDRMRTTVARLDSDCTDGVMSSISFDI